MPKVLTNTPRTQSLSFWSCPSVIDKHIMLSKDEKWISCRHKLNEKFNKQNDQSRSDSHFLTFIFQSTAFWLRDVKAKQKESQQSIRWKKKIFTSRCELEVKTTKLAKVRENAGDQVMIGVTFTSNWLRKWHELSGPITERSRVKPMQSWITFDYLLKISLKITIKTLIMIYDETSSSNK